MHRACAGAYRSGVDIGSPLPGTEPPRDCQRCPRLVALRRECQAEHPDWWSAPVHAFGDPDAWLAFAGLAPGKHGANRTGRPFTGDYAGDLLFATLAEYGLSKGRYDARIDDGLTLEGAIIVNSVKCLPPQNKPTPAEIASCRPFFEAQLAALPTVGVIIALGRIAHDAALRAFGERLAAHPFAHGAVHRLPGGRHLVDSYHCSRYNTNTGRLTAAMFADVFRTALRLKDQTSGPNSSTSPR
nr:uracil-DNA glycosylase [Sphingopyxis panaciterrae]